MWLWLYVVMALCSYGSMWLWLYVVMALCSYGSGYGYGYEHTAVRVQVRTCARAHGWPAGHMGEVDVLGVEALFSNLTTI